MCFVLTWETYRLSLRCCNALLLWSHHKFVGCNADNSVEIAGPFSAAKHIAKERSVDICLQNLCWLFLSLPDTSPGEIQEIVISVVIVAGHMISICEGV